MRRDVLLSMVTEMLPQKRVGRGGDVQEPAMNSGAAGVRPPAESDATAPALIS